MSENKESKLIRILGCSIPFLLVAYILSFGPVLAFLAESNGTVPKMHHAYLDSFYAPLFWAFDYSPKFGSLYYEYFKLCRLVF